MVEILSLIECRPHPIPRQFKIGGTSPRPLEEKVSSWTQPPLFSSMCRKTPFSVSQSRIVPSSEADANHRLSDEKARDLTASLCPSSVRCKTPVSASHNRIALRLEADAIHWPLGEKIASLIGRPCSCNRCPDISLLRVRQILWTLQRSRLNVAPSNIHHRVADHIYNCQGSQCGR